MPPASICAFSQFSFLSTCWSEFIRRNRDCSAILTAQQFEDSAKTSRWFKDCDWCDRRNRTVVSWELRWPCVAKGAVCFDFLFSFSHAFKERRTSANRQRPASALVTSANPHCKSTAKSTVTSTVTSTACDGQKENPKQPKAPSGLSCVLLCEIDQQV